MNLVPNVIGPPKTIMSPGLEGIALGNKVVPVAEENPDCTIDTFALIVILHPVQGLGGAMPPCQKAGSSKVRLDGLEVIELYTCPSEI
jgi:hypothetical protein